MASVVDCQPFIVPGVHVRSRRHARVVTGAVQSSTSGPVSIDVLRPAHSSPSRARGRHRRWPPARCSSIEVERRTSSTGRPNEERRVVLRRRATKEDVAHVAAAVALLDEPDLGEGRRLVDAARHVRQVAAREVEQRGFETLWCRYQSHSVLIGSASPPKEARLKTRSPVDGTRDEGDSRRCRRPRRSRTRRCPSAGGASSSARPGSSKSPRTAATRSVLP